MSFIIMFIKKFLEYLRIGFFMVVWKLWNDVIYFLYFLKEK